MDSKLWRIDGKPEEFAHIADPCIEAMRFAIKNGKRVNKTGIKWTGLGLGEKDRCTCIEPSEWLDAHNLNFAWEEHNQDAIERIIIIAIQLGVEQGRRLQKTDTLEKVKELRISMLVYSMKKEMDKLLKLAGCEKFDKKQST